MSQSIVLLRSELYNDFQKPIGVRSLMGAAVRLRARSERDSPAPVFRAAAVGSATAAERRANTWHLTFKQALQVTEQAPTGTVQPFSRSGGVSLPTVPHGVALVKWPGPRPNS